MDTFDKILRARARAATKTISQADIARCPLLSLHAAHFREDGTCLCFPARERFAVRMLLPAEEWRFYNDAWERRLRQVTHAIYATHAEAESAAEALRNAGPACGIVRVWVVEEADDSSQG